VATFVLVHGSWYGVWCWARVIPEPHRLGPEVVAVDLPSDDPSASTVDLVDAIAASITDPSNTVGVAHSMAGLLAPIVASKGPAQKLVFPARALMRELLAVWPT
jgi:hypothetical protein